ncbi:MAG: hypothetical protein AAF679_14850 [Pseudomonadota bacterium]
MFLPKLKTLTIALAAATALAGCAELEALAERIENPQTVAGLFVKLKAEAEFREFVASQVGLISDMSDEDLALLSQACGQIGAKNILDQANCRLVQAEEERRAALLETALSDL